jgi:DNA-binding response OmpR family regulator
MATQTNAARRRLTAAAVEYIERQKTCRTLLAEVKAALERHQARQATDARNWGYVGDLGKVEEDLRGILLFVGGEADRQ